jgi:hypothetical protein
MSRDFGHEILEFTARAARNLLAVNKLDRERRGQFALYETRQRGFFV